MKVSTLVLSRLDDTPHVLQKFCSTITWEEFIEQRKIKSCFFYLINIWLPPSYVLVDTDVMPRDIIRSCFSHMCHEKYCISNESKQLHLRLFPSISLSRLILSHGHRQIPSRTLLLASQWLMNLCAWCHPSIQCLCIVRHLMGNSSRPRWQPCDTSKQLCGLQLEPPARRCYLLATLARDKSLCWQLAPSHAIQCWIEIESTHEQKSMWIS